MIAVVEAHPGAIRSSSHSSMKAEIWFQLRVAGVTTIKARLRPGFFYRQAQQGSSRTCDFRSTRPLLDDGGLDPLGKQQVRHLDHTHEDRTGELLLAFRIKHWLIGHENRKQSRV